MGDNTAELLKIEIGIEDEICALKPEIRNCSECKNIYDGIRNLMKIEFKDERNSIEELKALDYLYSKIKNWEIVTTCDYHVDIGKRIETKVRQLKKVSMI